jgi:peptide/nickel transport system permease protein
MSLGRILFKRWQYTLGAGLLIMFILLALFGTVLYPNGTPINPANVYGPPTWAAPFGTDFAGRNILGEVVLGTRYVLEIAGLAGLFTLIMGVTVGLLTGMVGGIVDSVFMRLIDFFLSVPSYPLLIIIADLVHTHSIIVLAVILSLWGWAGMARAIRSQVLTLKRREYIEAANSLQMPRLYIAIREVFPALMPYVVMHLIMAITGAVYGEVGLFFLGLVPIQADNWGLMLNWAYSVSGAIYSKSSILFMAAPLLAIILFQTGSVFFNQALEEFFNPNLQYR